MGPSAFFVCLFVSSPVQSALNMWQSRLYAECWLIFFFFNYDTILNKMFQVPYGLLHHANSIFFIQTFSIRASVLLVFSLLKTTESGCSQGSIDRALWLLNSSTLFCFCFEHLTLPNSHLQHTTVTIVAQTNKQTNKCYKAKLLKC